MKVFKFLAPLALLASSSAFATFGIVPAEPITIETLTANGSGCKAGTFETNVSEDKQAFTVSFSELIAEVGPGVSLTAGRKNCNLTLNLDVPHGWQYSIASFNFRGFYQLDAGVKGQQTATYFLEGDQAQKKFTSTVYGPSSEDYVYTDNIGIEAAVWSACGVKRALNVNSVVHAQNMNKRMYPHAQGIITNDTIDGELKQVWGFGLAWRKCEAAH